MSRETALAWIATSFLIAKVFFKTIWREIVDTLKYQLSDGFLAELIAGSALIAFVLQIFFAFATGGTSLLTAPLGWAIDTAFTAAVGTAIVVLGSVVIGFVKGVMKLWNAFRLAKSFMPNTTPAEDEVYESSMNEWARDTRERLYGRNVTGF